MVVRILRQAGLTGVQGLLNSVGCSNCRPRYIELLRQELQQVKERMCEDCRRRADTNPLRVLDCKVEADQPIIDKLPSILDHLCEICKPHFAAVQGYLGDAGIEYEIRPRLV